MKKQFLQTAILIAIFAGFHWASSSSSSQADSNSKSKAQPLSWYCNNLVGKTTSEVQSILGMQDDCYDCNTTYGEMQYRDATFDAMGTVTRLQVHYYEGVVTWVRAGYGSGARDPGDSNDCTK